MTLRELTQHESLRGIAIGACIAGDRWKGEDGHAHFSVQRYRGWICVASLRHFNRTTVTHELAHLILGNDRHAISWKRMVRQLGGRVERRYL